MARSVRQGFLASGFLFAMAFDPIFRWLQNTIIPRNPAAPDVLQPAPWALQWLMTALSPAFKVVDQTAELNLNHRT